MSDALNLFIPFPPRLADQTFSLAADPDTEVRVSLPPVAGIHLTDLLYSVEAALVSYAYQRRLPHNVKLVVYFSQELWDMIAGSGDIRYWAKVRGALFRTLPSDGIFLSMLDEGSIKARLFLIIPAGDL